MSRADCHDDLVGEIAIDTEPHTAHLHEYFPPEDDTDPASTDQPGSSSPLAEPARGTLPGPPVVARRRKRGRGLPIVLASAALLIVATVVVGITVGQPDPVAPSADRAQRAGLPPSTTSPVVPGFQGLLHQTFQMAYDVPADWTVDSSDKTRGFGPPATGHGSAVSGAGYCPSHNRAVSFISPSVMLTEADAADRVGPTAASVGYGATVTTRTAESFTTATGITGTFVEISGYWHHPDSTCTSTAFSIYTFAFHRPNGGPIAVLTVCSDRGVPGEIDPVTARVIASSLRAD